MRELFMIGLLAGLGLSTSAKAQSLPAGSVSCQMAGYLIDTDPKGANVRAAPSTAAKIVGKLAGAQKAQSRDEAYPVDGLWRTEFRIVGFKDGWFLIEKAMHPYNRKDFIESSGRRSTGGVKTFSGRGWIAAGLVGGQYSNGANLPSGGLFNEPDASSKATPAKNALGADVGADGGPKKVLACKGRWVQVESHDGVVGWWNSLCSNQVTNCS